MAALWVLVLVTAELGLTRASPVPTSKPATTRSGCNFSRFKSLSPRELAAFKKAKDAWVSPHCCVLISPPALAKLLLCYRELTSILPLQAGL